MSGGERTVAALAGSAAHVFLDDLDALEVSGDDHAHLMRVLRLRPGEAVSASDGAGGWRPATWTGDARLEAAGPVRRVPRPQPAITVAPALLKGERLEWAVQKLTEVGADRIVPLATERVVVRWDAPRRRRAEARLRAVAKAAAMQSRRVWLPEVEEVRNFDSVLAGAASAPAPAGASMAVPGGDPPDLSRPVVLVGPEGGWSDSELSSGLPAVGLGPTVLRAETAAVVAGCLLAALRSRLVQPAAAGGDASCGTGSQQ